MFMMGSERFMQQNIQQVTPSNNPSKLYFWAVSLIIAMHTAGFVGLQWSVSRAFFEMLIPFNLLSSTFILLYFHQDWRASFYVFMLCSFLVGFSVEWLGVHTGLIFGSYQYGPNLGYKLDEIPLLIGLNWLVLIYATGNIAMRLSKNNGLRIILGATLMVWIDILIEPVAIKHGMWNWNTAAVPLQNYVAWFVVAAFLLFIFFKLQFNKQNIIAAWLYVAQFFFFLFHNIAYFFHFF